MLHRILRRQHGEGVAERARHAIDRHLPLGHSLQQRCLCLRWRAIDLVAEQEVGEDRTGLELEAARRVSQHVDPRHVGWHQVRRELDSREAQPERRGQRPGEQRLRCSRHSLDEHMAPCEVSHEDVRHRVFLADDPRRDDGANAGEERGAFGDADLFGHARVVVSEASMRRKASDIASRSRSPMV